MASFSLWYHHLKFQHDPELGFGQRGGLQLGRCLAGLLLSDNAVMGTGYKFIAQCVFSFYNHRVFSYDDSRERRRIQSTGSNDNELYIKSRRTMEETKSNFSKPLQPLSTLLSFLFSPLHFPVSLFTKISSLFKLETAALSTANWHFLSSKKLQWSLGKQCAQKHRKYLLEKEPLDSSIP